MRFSALTIPALLLTAACGSSQQGGSSPRPSTGGKPSCLNLVNGIVTTKYPAVVPLDTVGGGLCTGTFVSDTTVLTASHCLDTSPGGGVSYGGVAAKKAFNSGVVGTTQHEVAKDLSVLVFPASTAPATAKLANVKPKEGDKLLLVGYGQTDFVGDNQPDGQKRYGYNSLVALMEQGTVLNYKSPVDPSNLKQGDQAMTGRGDSGGPIFTDAGLIGIVSQGGVDGQTVQEFDLNLFSEPAMKVLEAAVKGGASIPSFNIAKQAFLGQTTTQPEDEPEDDKPTGNSTSTLDPDDSKSGKTGDDCKSDDDKDGGKGT